MKQSLTARGRDYLCWAVLALVVVGFWFDTSRKPEFLGKYSERDLIVLIEITIAALALGFYIRFLSRPQFVKRSHGRTIEVGALGKALFTVVMLAAILIPIEWVLAARYQAVLLERRSEKAAYDPYLQAIPPKNDELLGTNRWGFRGEEIDVEKPDDVFRIFVIGGSTVYCDRVERSESHAWLMQEQLRRHFGAPRIEVQNAGMHWHTTQHSIMKYLFSIEDFNPDLVIIYHGINDLVRSWSPDKFAEGDYRRDYSHYRGPVSRMARTYFNSSSPPRLRSLNQAVKYVRRRWFSDFRDPRGPQAPVAELRFESFSSANSFERNLENMAQILESQGVALIMASQPFLYKEDMTDDEEATVWIPSMQKFGRNRPDIRSMINGMSHFNSRSRAVAERAGVLYVDLEALVPKRLDYFFDGVHYTPKGNEIIGRALAEGVIRGGYVEKKFPEAVRR